MKNLQSHQIPYTYSFDGDPALANSFLQYAKAYMYWMVQNPRIPRMQHLSPDVGVDIWIYKNPNKIFIKAAPVKDTLVTYMDVNDTSGPYTGWNIAHTQYAPPFQNSTNRFTYKNSFTPANKTNTYAGGNATAYGLGGSVVPSSWVDKKNNAALSWIDYQNNTTFFIGGKFGTIANTSTTAFFNGACYIKASLVGNDALGHSIAATYQNVVIKMYVQVHGSSDPTHIDIYGVLPSTTNPTDQITLTLVKTIYPSLTGNMTSNSSLGPGFSNFASDGVSLIQYVNNTAIGGSTTLNLIKFSPDYTTFVTTTIYTSQVFVEAIYADSSGFAMVYVTPYVSYVGQMLLTAKISVTGVVTPIDSIFNGPTDGSPYVIYASAYNRVYITVVNIQYAGLTNIGIVYSYPDPNNTSQLLNTVLTMSRTSALDGTRYTYSPTSAPINWIQSLYGVYSNAQVYERMNCEKNNNILVAIIGGFNSSQVATLKVLLGTHVTQTTYSTLSSTLYWTGVPPVGLMYV